MYPFKVILIGNDELLLPHVRRELMNQSAEIEREFRNVDSAIEQLTLQHDDARLFVIHIDDFGQLDILKRLRGTFAGRPILVLMDGKADSSLLVHAMRYGASQVVMLPLAVAEFTEALDGISVQFGHLANHKQVIAVTAAHGGVGSTSVAVDLAYELAQHYQLNTILVELQQNVGMLTSFLKIAPKYTTDQLLEMGYSVDLCAIKTALVPFGDRLSILAGPLHLRTPPQIESSMVLHLVQCIGHLADIIVLDVPSTLDDHQLGVLNSADKVLVVAEQTIPSLQLTIEMLQLGLGALAPTIVINRYDSSIKGFDVNHLRQVLGVNDVKTIVNDQSGFHAARNQGQPLRLASPTSKAIGDIDTIADHLLGTKHTSEAKAAHHGILSQFSQMLGI